MRSGLSMRRGFALRTDMRQRNVISDAVCLNFNTASPRITVTSNQNVKECEFPATNYNTNL